MLLASKWIHLFDRPLALQYTYDAQVTNEDFPSTDTTAFWSRNLYLSIYGVLGLLQSVAIMLGTVVLSVGTLNAATTLHGTMLKR